MSSNSLSQQEAVEILNKWGDDGFFRLNQFGNLISIEQITPFTCVTSSVQTQYEDRDIETRFEPYSGGRVDSGRPPDAWDIKIPSPADFTKAKNEYAVPQGERVETCTNCSGRGEKGCSPCYGSGKTTCLYCSGSGQTNCTSCGGSGYKTESRSKNESYYDYSGNTTEWRTVYENVQVNCYSCTFGKVNCYSCTFGKVTCSSCGGRGIVTCGTCSGYGKVKFYKVLVVKHSHKVQRAIINHSDIADKRLFKTSGEVIVDAKQARIKHAGLLLKDDKKLSSEFVQVTDLAKISTADCPSCGAALTLPNQEAAPVCQDPWHDKQNGEEKDLISMVSLKDEAVSSIEGLIKLTDEKEGEILFQRLLVQGIDTYKIEYKRGGKPGKPIWIYGKEKKIFTTGTPPLDWRRVGAVSALAAIMLVLLVVFIASSNTPTTYQPQQDTQSKSVEITAVASKGAVVRKGAGAEFPKVAELKKGQIVTLLSDVQTAKSGGAWEKIRVDNVEGYVNQKLLTKNENNNSDSVAQTYPVPNETESVMQAVREFWEAARLQDEKRLQDIVDDDYISSLGKNKEVYMKGLLAPELTFKSVNVDYENAKVQLNGDKATVTYKAKYIITRNSETLSVDNRSVDTFINRGGKWRAYRGTSKQSSKKEAAQSDIKKLGNSLRPESSLKEAKRKDAPANDAKTISDRPIPVVGNVEMIGRDGVGRPTIFYKERAAYTEQARQNKTEGEVILSVVFTVDGHVADIQVTQGLPYGLNDAAIEAAKKIRFKPATKNGQPVNARGRIEYKFYLQ